MYDDAEKHIDRILELVKKCPATLQEKCFEVLLSGYVEQSTFARSKRTSDDTEATVSSQATKSSTAGDAAVGVPQEIKARFNSTAKRIGVTPELLAALFDFSTDPFTYHALEVPGTGKAEKTRNVALLIAARNYLVTGQWTGDWKEFRAMCVDQNCYDRTNNPQIMKHQYFKSASAETGVALSGGGQKAAEALLATLAKPEA